ncbi:MAG: VWA domain-containing protein [Myxococcales bacterium]|nr:VWA domain-containing protein [Myxococcales bacterium]
MATAHLARSAPLLALLAALTGACASDAGDSGYGTGLDPQDAGVGVGQGGAQDFGQFRAILEDGGIPDPSTLDDVGFFNEHKIPLPNAGCEDAVCLHGLFGSMGNMISGSRCNVVLLGMNTPIDPDTLERPPLNLALAIDVSGSMRGENLDYTVAGLSNMLDKLEPGDRVSLVTFNSEAEILADALAGDDPALAEAIDGLWAEGGTNLYDGLRTAFELVSAHADAQHQNRVLLLSDGVASAGIEEDAQLVDLARAWAEEGVSVSTIGMGDEFDATLMRELSEVGAGAFYYVEDPEAVLEVFTEEVEAFLVPLAEALTIDADIDGDYRLRGVYGTKLFELGVNKAHIEIPTVQLAHRTTPAHIEGGRRGGGGAILLELVNSAAPTGDGAQVGSLRLQYRVPGSDALVEQEVDITSPLSIGEDDAWFETESVEKGFVTLNIYMGFAMASQRAAGGDGRGALTLLTGLAANVEGWLTSHDDADIEDDLLYIHMFVDNLIARGATLPPDSQTKPEPEPWPQD